MGAEDGYSRSSIPEGPDGDVMRREAMQYPSWRDMHLHTGHVAVAPQVVMNPVLVREPGVAHTERDLGMAVAENAQVLAEEAGKT